jgi:hypothetical protein
VRVRAEDSGTDKGEADVLPRLQPDGSKIFELNSPIENLNSEAQNRLGVPQGGGDKVLADLVDAGGQNYDGLVSKKYDQSGNSNDASQSNASNQPQIVSGGTVIKENGKPAIEFDPTTSETLESSKTIQGVDSNTGAFSSFGVLKFLQDASPAIALDKSNRIAQMLKVSSSNNSLRTIQFNTRGVDIDDFSPTNSKYIDNQVLQTSIGTGSSLETFANGNGNGSVSISNPATAESEIQLNRNGKGDLVIQEIIHYAKDKSSNRTKIETNINNHYSIF